MNEDLLLAQNGLIVPEWIGREREARASRPQIRWPETREQAQYAAAQIQKDAFDHGCLCAQLQVQFLELPNGKKGVQLNHAGHCPLAGRNN